MMNINLNRREKLAVYGGGIAVAIFIVVQLSIAPLFEKREALHEKLSAKRRTIAEMQQLQREHQELQKDITDSMSRFEQRPRQFTLFSFLDQLAGETGIKTHVSYMKPSTTINEKTGVSLSRVEMELREISLKDLTRYLYEVETSENMVIVKRLSISRTGREKAMIDAVMQVETVEI